MRTGDGRGAHARPLGRLVALLALSGLAGCGSSMEVPALHEGEVWIIGIADPRGDWSECFSDDSIEQALTTADMPASSSTATFRQEAEEGDVRKVMACLDRSLTGGEVAVTTVEIR